jgi:hypothetical protein
VTCDETKASLATGLKTAMAAVKGKAGHDNAAGLVAACQLNQAPVGVARTGDGSQFG